ncbi:MAG: DUF4169 family protein [Methylovirgula sp.]
MSAEVVNLRRVRKAKQRVVEADKAAGNRVRFGKSKAQRSLETAVEARDQRMFEGHRLDGVRSGPDTDAAPSTMSEDRLNGQ